MKVSRITIIVCLLLDVLVGVLLWLLHGKSDLTVNLLLGVFTGLIVAAVTSAVAYFNEKVSIYNKAKSQLPEVYADLFIIHQMTGSILGRIIHSYKLDDLNFRSLVSLSDMVAHAIDKGSLTLYSPFFTCGKWGSLIDRTKSFEEKLWGLKFCLSKLQKSVLDADLLQLEKATVIQSAVVSFAKEPLLEETRNLVNIQTAKVHEFQASLLLELGEICFGFYGDVWEKTKSQITTNAESISKQL